MFEPTTITINAVDDATQDDHLIVELDNEQALLSFEDQDELRWVCIRSTATIRFAPANNPFDPTATTGGTYEVPAGGSVISGPPEEIVLDQNANVFRVFKYSVTVTDGTRAGSRDPRVRVRRNRVY